MASDHIPNPDDRNREVVYLRIPLSLLERVDAHREAMQRSAPGGVDVTRSAAIRNLLELALASGEERAA